jgi:hypothetical protein
MDQGYIHPFIAPINRNGVEPVRNFYLLDVFGLADLVAGNGSISERVA